MRESAGPPTPSGRLRVLLVDDHAAMRAALARVIGVEPDLDVVGQTGSAFEAVDLASSLAPHVVVLDVNLPEMDGVALTRRLTAAHPDLHVVGLSMHDDRAIEKRMLEAGAAAYVLKGGSPSELLQAIRSRKKPL
jgi:DNA-binding NarL/FixJ family response regulator